MEYICKKCGYVKKGYFGLCPICKDGQGEPIDEDVKNENDSIVNVYDKVLRVDKNAKIQKGIRFTQYQDFNQVLSENGGFVPGQVILLASSPGIGKSTLCLSIADEKTLYISSEESFNQVNSRALRVNPDCNCEIFNSTSIDEILSAIKNTESELIIVDSINSIEFGVGYLTTAKYTDRITNLVKSENKICIIISQVAKNGEISGLNSLQHIVDTIIYLERSEISTNIIATSTKNRFGEIGSVAIFNHSHDGLVEIKNELDTYENEIGTTFTETIFGHKRMKIAIDSLVVVSNSQYGLKKSNGYSQNRLLQIVAIVSYYGKINLNDRDVYINISNGLYTDDISVELAIANSILSSFYKKNTIKFAKGEIRLSGRVINGAIDGKEITHINELIQLYSR